ncbi:Swt1 family HEPN domain-containing protein [Leucobacter soli]|uniref:Swt1 family HEPN domain-containing protein n=1 Tax=Leucobacter soli TaxID=2812850 RepID=UPI00360B9768
MASTKRSTERPKRSPMRRTLPSMRCDAVVRSDPAAAKSLCSLRGNCRTGTIRRRTTASVCGRSCCISLVRSTTSAAVSMSRGASCSGPRLAASTGPRLTSSPICSTRSARRRAHRGPDPVQRRRRILAGDPGCRARSRAGNGSRRRARPTRLRLARGDLTMAISNKERVGRALEQLGSALEPFVEEVLQPHVPAGLDWTAILKAKDGDGRDGRDYDPADVQIQLRAVTERLGALGFPFGERLSRGEQNLAGEMREVRNRWAHDPRPFSADDTYRALDTCERLLRAIGAPSEADSVRRMRADAQRATYAEETRRDTRAAVSAMPDLADAELTPWRDVLSPHPDIAAGDFARAEFAADLHQVATGEASPEYGDPIQFFQRTYLTEGLKTLLTMSAKRISGDPNAQSVINLQTTFGGGKTHSMLAAWHLFSGQPLDDYPQQVQDVLGAESAGTVARSVKRVAIVGNEMAPGQSTTKADGTVLNTVWGSSPGSSAVRTDTLSWPKPTARGRTRVKLCARSSPATRRR